MKMNDFRKEVEKLIQDNVKPNKVSTSKVDSPYAKYNSRGQLMCIVCGVQVKSKIIWQAHINKRSHKETLQRLKEKQEKISKLQFKKSEKDSKKRSLSPDSVISKNKHLKGEKPKGILKNISTYSSSEEESDSEDLPSNGVDIDVKNVKIEPFIKSEASDPVLNEDTQGAGSSKASEDQKGNPSKEAPKSKSEALPEGFFDDPVADAKARNVEYRDKDAEEWESFMKEVSAAEVESRQIIAEDKEEAAFETQLEQADEQIKCLERIIELDKAKQDQLSEKKNSAKDSGDHAESSDEEFSPVIWRTKNSLI